MVEEFRQTNSTPLCVGGRPLKFLFLVQRKVDPRFLLLSNDQYLCQINVIQMSDIVQPSSRLLYF